MHRRSLLLGAAATTLARPAIGNTTSTLKFVPPAALSSIDPVWTSAMTVRNFGMMVFETLYGRDADMNPKPQMLAGEVIDDDGKRRTMTLRDGLRFHDGEKVLARDCVASLRRWMKRDPVGATIETRVDALEAPNDRTIVWRLNKPFPHLPKALSKMQTAAVMMPARIAATDRFKQIPEAIGCGPFRFLASEQVIGSFAAFAKFDGYVPRDEPPSFTSGGHHVLLDRVEWQMIPEAATAANALVTGEIDWIEMPVPDLLPLLKRGGAITERLAVHLRHAGAGIARPATGVADPQQRREGLVRMAGRSEDRGDLQPMAGRSGPRGTDSSGARVPASRLGVRPLHPDGLLHVAHCVEPQTVQPAERASPGILECEQGLAAPPP